MSRLDANRTQVEGQSSLNLRPLPNLIGHNGPYFGKNAPIEQDAARIEGHSPLFRSLDTFEADLRQAVLWLWDSLTVLRVSRDEVDAGEDTIEELLASTAETLDLAFKWMQEAFLIAEVLDEREQRRIRNRADADFLALVSKAPRDDMTAMERLAEEGRLNWQMAHLRNRLDVVAKSLEHGKWSEAYLEEVFRAVTSLERTNAAPCADALQAMNDNDLSAELVTLEERARDTRKAISLIHAIRTVRNA